MSQKSRNSTNQTIVGRFIWYGISAICIVTFGSFCNNAKKNANEEAIEHRADTIAQAGIYFIPPANSTVLPEDSVTKLKTNGYNKKSPVSIVPVKVYVDSLGLICTISKLKGMKESDHDSLVHKYTEFIESTFSDTVKIDKNESDLNGFRVIQFKIAAPEETVFKIIYNSPSGSLFQIDYVIYNHYLDSNTVTNVALSAQSVRPIGNR